MIHVLITNQHGENRGDESALRAMLNGISEKFECVKFTVIAQLQDTEIMIDFDEDVSLVHMKMSISSFLGLVIYSLFKKIGLNASFLLNNETERIINAYRECNVVVSAPGGPYFGDIYGNHEIVHWFYIWLGVLFKKPLFLYAPSAGPFKKIWLNIIRKYFYKKFDVLCLREEISKGYLQKLIGHGKEIIVTADSAIQQIVEPLNRDDYFVGGRKSNKEKFLVAVSAIEYSFPGDPNSDVKQKEYTHILLECLSHLLSRRQCHFIFIPQLYGMVHTDIPFLTFLASNLPDNATFDIIDQSLDSNYQRAIIGMCDICIASRYHPQIFAGTSAVPGICFYYEHKALGFMKLMELERFAFDIRNLNLKEIIAGLDEVVENLEKIKFIMKQNAIPVRESSKQTTKLLSNLISSQSL